MKVRSLKVFAPALLLVLLLSASSTAYADAIAFTSFSFTQIQFTAATGTAVFTPTALNTRAQVTNSLGGLQDNVSSTFPIAQANSSVTFASASGTAVTPNISVGGSTTADPRGAVTSSGFALATLTGTLVVTGAEGAVNVTVSGIQTLLQHVETDEFGVFAESGINFDMFLNGLPVFSLQIDRLMPIQGPNGLGHVEGIQQIARLISVQAGATNNIEFRLSTTSIAVSDVPEPATVVLLVSGLGFMTGFLKQKRKQS